MKQKKDTPPPSFDDTETGLYAVLSICIIWGLLIVPLVVPDMVQAMGLR